MAIQFDLDSRSLWFLLVTDRLMVKTIYAEAQMAEGGTGHRMSLQPILNSGYQSFTLKE